MNRRCTGEHLTSQRDRLRAHMLDDATTAGLDLSHRICSMMDQLLQKTFRACTTETGHESLACALCAVGSYGHGSPGLFSDLDLRLVPRQMDQTARTFAQSLHQHLRACGAPVSLQLVDIDTLIATAAEELTTATTLLDWRHIDGCSSISEEVMTRAEEEVLSAGRRPELLDQLAHQAELRMQRFDASVYLLEPDLKQGRGGLRDLDLIRWTLRLCSFGTQDMPRNRWLLEEEQRDLTSAENHVATVRNLLHHLAGRRCDRLSFRHQERIASLLGYANDPSGVERFMRKHVGYRRQIANIRETLLSCHHAQPPAAPTIDSIRKKILDNPAWPLTLYVRHLEQGTAMPARTRASIRRALTDSQCKKAVCDSTKAKALFLRLCATPQENALLGGSVLRDMHEAGLLATMIPEMGPLIGQTHHDIYHVLTVDAHSIAAVDRLHQLLRGVSPSPDEFACHIAQQLSSHQLLSLAVLLHDIGKGKSRKKHAEIGAEIAQRIATRLGLSNEEALLISHLVHNHLFLYHTATRRDLSSPDVLDDVLTTIKDTKGLQLLWLLTYVDVATTSPDTMNAWKASLLQQLYLKAHRAIIARQNTIDSRSSTTPPQLREVVNTLPIDLKRLFETMPARYRRAATPERVERHLLLIKNRQGSSINLNVEPSSVPDVAEVAVVLNDAPGLLAKIAYVLSNHQLSVLEAAVNSRQTPPGNHEAVDFFVVRGAMVRSSRRRALLKSQLRRDLERVIEDAEMLTKQKTIENKPLSQKADTPHVTCIVRLHPPDSDGLSIIETFTADRHGLLFDLALAFHRLDLEIVFAKISTEGEKVADVFYVRDKSAHDISSPERQEQVRQHLLEVLQDA